MKYFGVEFAPMDIPMERRLQTLAAVLQIVIIVFGGPIGCLIAIYLIFFTQYYWYVLAYICYIIGQRGVASRGVYSYSQWIRRWTLWVYYRDYFPTKLVKTAELDPARNYLLGCFPHGIIASSSFINFGTEANKFSEVFPGVSSHLITLDSNFSMPFFREIILRMGMCSASKQSLNNLLDSVNGTGRAAALVVGGAAESLKCKPGSYSIILKSRKGFIKLALQNGACLVPVFSFGENELFNPVSNPEGSLLRKCQEYVRKVTGIAPVLVVGRGMFQYTFGLVPQRRSTTTVVGKPIVTERVPEPTQEQIDDLHRRFEQELVALFEEHKHKYHKSADKISLLIE